MRSLSYEFPNPRSGYYELNVRAIISALVNVYEISSLDDFERIFKEDIKRIRRVSTASAHTLYYLERVKILGRGEYKDSIIIWHINCIGEVDRVVAEITTLPKPLKL